MKKNILIIGQGAIGKPLAQRLSHQHSVTTVARTHKTYQEPISFWQQDACTLTAEQLQAFTHIIIIVAPTKQAGQRATVSDYQSSYLAICQHLAQLAEASAESFGQLQRIVFVSSTSVYGENQGEWIDETTPAAPATKTAQVLLDAENALRNAFCDQVVIVRPSGIYGVTRTRLLRQAKEVHQTGVVAQHFTNRIMDSDLVAVLEKIALLAQPKLMYLATDFMPVTSAQVLTYLAQLMGLAEPKLLSDNTQANTSGKRIMANIEKSWLQFVDYQSGYRWVVEQNSAMSI